MTEAVARGARWLREAHNPDGGWGESCEGYERQRFERAASTPSQTAWAVLGLIAAGQAMRDAVRDGVGWLCKHQRADGTWEESVTTGTGFPRVFYISYNLYRVYFPVLALDSHVKATDRLKE